MSAIAFAPPVIESTATVVDIEQVRSLVATEVALCDIDADYWECQNDPDVIHVYRTLGDRRVQIAATLPAEWWSDPVLLDEYVAAHARQDMPSEVIATFLGAYETGRL